ncbi:beta-glucosidase [Geosmithia morbida]|uniref:Beta-glucosidase cel3A n=1 Tax=Geosmithia morbida TaxID=1094350 RepID=A0A9P5D309_9HYPO|nr:beta-glucosidase [Geosmithia morbida]KAF4122041.1 beta-glucosidase [Geosmithia morbida]
MRSFSTATTLALAALPFASAQLSWEEAYAKAEAAVSKLSLADKADIVTGTGWKQGVCVGNTVPIDSIGYPALCLQDGPLGIRYATNSTAFTPAIQAASTWDIDLIRQREQFHAEEARALGIHVLLGPACGTLGKIPEAGRGFEGWGPDPYLAGIGAGASVAAIQAAGVQATIKHFIANEQETSRMIISSNVDDKTMHEIYLWPFYDAVHAGVAAAMCSYNKIDGTWACESDIMDKFLKRQLGFKGYIMSDWTAQHSTVKSALAGLDMSMPGSGFEQDDVYWGPQLEAAVDAGDIPQSRVDDMVTRILAGWYKLEQEKGYPSTDLTREVEGNHHTNVRACARDGTVLLKNDDGILPLSGPANIAVIGSDAVAGNHSRNLCNSQACNDGALGMGWGSGAANYTYFVTPIDAISKIDGINVTLSGTDDAGKGAAAAADADLALVFITSDSGEGNRTVEGSDGDRLDLTPWHHGNELVRAVAEANENVIVVIHSVGPVILSEILSLPSVKAIVWAGLPSSESGNALVDIVWGGTSPSGKLVYTIAKKAGDYNATIIQGDEDNFEEGVYIDYRHFDHAGIEPEYEFGFGLCESLEVPSPTTMMQLLICLFSTAYTNFSYADLTVNSRAKPGLIGQDGLHDLFEDVASVTATVKNTGAVAGSEVAQLYISYPKSAAQPPKQLRGFDKLPLKVGESGTAIFSIRKRDLAVWDTKAEQWTIPRGIYSILVGASSRDIRLEGKIEIA